MGLFCTSMPLTRPRPLVLLNAPPLTQSEPEQERNVADMTTAPKGDGRRSSRCSMQCWARVGAAVSLAGLAALIVANIVVFAVVLPRSQLGELPETVDHADLSAAVEIQYAAIWLRHHPESLLLLFPPLPPSSPSTVSTTRVVGSMARPQVGSMARPLDMLTVDLRVHCAVGSIYTPSTQVRSTRHDPHRGPHNVGRTLRAGHGDRPIAALADGVSGRTCDFFFFFSLSPSLSPPPPSPSH